MTVILQAPASTIPIIIGPKGATLKQVRDQTGVRIDIPRKDAPGANGQANGGSHEPSRTATPLPSAGDEEEELTVPVTIIGAEPLVLEAQALLQSIIATKTSRGTQRVKNIPAHILPFILPRRAKFLEAAEGADVTLSLNRNDDGGEIIVYGDREALGRVVDTIKSAVEYFTANVTSLKMTLPKRQHRLLMGKGAEEVMAKSQCAVVVQKIEEPGAEVTVWGRAQDLANGLTAVMEKANSAYIHEFPLPGPIPVSRQLLSYMTRIEYPKTLSEENPGVQVYTPPQAIVDRSQVLNVDILGDKPAVDSAVRQLSQLVGKLIGATKDVPIDWLVHRIINSHKNAKKLVLLTCEIFAHIDVASLPGSRASTRTITSWYFSLRSPLNSHWSFSSMIRSLLLLLRPQWRKHRSSRRLRKSSCKWLVLPPMSRQRRSPSRRNGTTQWWAAVEPP